jgi:ubiquinone/menaquinone biosynthesis C-methylase UbiE
LAALRQDAPREDELTRVLRSLLAFRAGASIVDVGCGVGELSAWFAETAPGASVIGIEASVAMLKRATERATQSGLRRLTFAFGNAYHLPLQDASADLVVCKNLLCVLTDVDRAVAEMCRVAKPGGLVVVIEPASPHLFHDPHDPDFAKLSQRLNQAFYEGWRRRGVDQRVGLKVPGLFLRQHLQDIRVESVSRVHVLADTARTHAEIVEQLETESYRLPESTVALVMDGGFSRHDIEEHNRRARERLARFERDPSAATRSGYTRMNAASIVTVGRKKQQK